MDRASALPPETVEVVLRRAAELDADPPRVGLSVADVEAIAVEAGISVDAVRAALREARELGIDRTVGPDPAIEAPAATVIEQVKRVASERLEAGHRGQHGALEVASVLRDGERVLDLALAGRYDPLWGMYSNGTLAVTDRRVLFVRNRGDRRSLHDVPHGRITAIGVDERRRSAIMRIGSGNDAGLTFVIRPPHAAQRLAATIRHLSYDQPVAATINGEVVESLRRLAALRDDGVLTNEEFSVQKARLLEP